MLDLSEISDLDGLWGYTNELHRKIFPENKLVPILSGGMTKKPKLMFVFINPTYRNISSDPSWEGKRRPWTGTKYVWKVFSQAGHFDGDLLREISTRKEWDINFADKVYDHLANRGFYFTNLVKWTGANGDLPDSFKVKTFLPILIREIELVDPEYIVTFGLIPFKSLTNQSIKLGDYYEESIRKKRLKPYPLALGSRSFKVIPCYFPVGRGNPRRAVRLLSLLPA